MAPEISPTAFPLQIVTASELKELCQVLWNWEPLCDYCRDGGRNFLQRCRSTHCPWGQRSERLAPFFSFYRDTTSSYVPDFFGDEDQALRGHQDLLDMVAVLRQCGVELSRQACMRKYFSHRATKEGIATRQISVPESDQDRAFDLAIRVMTMSDIFCANNQNSYSGGDGQYGLGFGLELENGHHSKVAWPRDKHEPLQASIRNLFPSRIHPSLQRGDPYADVIRTNITADNLTRVARLKIEGTSNLLDHLKLDQATGVVQLFHHTGFLKEHLLATKHLASDGGDTKTCLLPREAALETLYTIQLLFPREGRSRALLRSLVSKQGFDPDCLRFGTAAFESSLDETTGAQAFPVWGTRIMDLYDEIENPKPRGVLDAWLERRSKSRHVMLATLIGVLVAVLLGLLGLCVSILQTWIAWQQWKSSSPTGNP